jgi:microcin C transport system substrate-binding protein
MKIAALVLAALALLPLPALADPAQNGPWQSGLSLVGAPKYAAGFKQFDYVNANAPKGGLARISMLGGFNTFNPILPEGDQAAGLGLIYEPLMGGSFDDPSASYPQIADAVAYPPDISSVTFRLNPKAKWQDGTAVTPEDVAWSFDELVKLNPNRQQYYADVKSAAVTAPDQVTFTLSTTNNREMPVILGQVVVLPKAWWTGKDANGKARDIGASTMELPMGSGPYKLASYDAGSSITYQRDPNYWGATEPFGIGTNNFDTLRFEYFKDPDVAFTGFTGDQFDWWSENSARRWATGYGFPAVKDKRVTQELFPQTYAATGVMVGFIPNLRIDKFKDQRVRQALADAFDFESLNKTLFYGQYSRIDSYYFGLPFASSGQPQGKELELLNTVKDKVPPEVFTTPYANPVAGDPTKLRANLKAALELLTAAGYKLDGNTLLDPSGNPFTIELLLDTGAIQPVAEAFQQNLKKLGIDMTIRAVDDSEYTARLRSRDFEMTYNAWVQSLSPGNEQRFMFGSAAADDPTTENYAGIKDAGVDALIEDLVQAKDHDAVLTAATALDRVLLAHSYVIPSYTNRNDRIARWDRFGHPDKLPAYSIGFPDIWWYDEAKAAVTGKAQ